MAEASIQITVRAHWVNACILLWATRPFVRIDDDQNQVDWSQPVTFAVTPGSHHLATFIRYRGFESRLGAGTLDLTVESGETVVVEARNGWLNHMPFVPRLVDRIRCTSPDC